MLRAARFDQFPAVILNHAPAQVIDSHSGTATVVVGWGTSGWPRKPNSSIWKETASLRAPRRLLNRG